MFSRRNFLKSSLAIGSFALLNRTIPVYASTRGLKIADRKETEDFIKYELVIRREELPIGIREGKPITVNGNFPAPLLRWKEGKEVIIDVINEMNEPTSIHWHGILLPNNMDGVPGLTYDGIAPKSRFRYRFPVKQYGTYWYHSHTGLQEQLGLYGAIIIDPINEIYKYDREYVVILSDWTFEDPYDVLAKLKKWDGYYNYQKRTVFDFFSDINKKGFSKAVSERLMWGKMRMSPRDLLDITGATYTYLINGFTPEEDQKFLFKPDEKIRLRFINASSSTIFDVRIHGLKMKVIQADGQYIQPVNVDEFRIGIAETYDVIVNPKELKAYPIFAEVLDRSGYAKASLTYSEKVSAPVPARRKITDRRMGHHHHHKGMDMGKMKRMDMMKMRNQCGDCEPLKIPDSFGVEGAMVNKSPRCRLNEAGIGLENAKHKVLTYGDLKSLKPFKRRKYDRKLDIHLVGSMERYVWRMYSYDGEKFTSEFKEPIKAKYGERVRINFINHTMMEHPMHLHGLWMYLDNGNGEFNPRKHTIIVKPGEKVCVEVDMDAIGNWAFHCHILYHMETGMFRVLQVCKTY